MKLKFGELINGTPSSPLDQPARQHLAEGRCLCRGLWLVAARNGQRHIINDSDDSASFYSNHDQRASAHSAIRGFVRWQRGIPAGRHFAGK